MENLSSHSDLEDSDEASSAPAAKPERLNAKSTDFLREIASVCDRAAAGDFEARLFGVDGSGPQADVVCAVNRLLDVMDGFVREASAALGAAGRGDFYRKVLLVGFGGAIREAAEALNEGSDAIASNERRQREAAKVQQEMAEKLSAQLTAQSQVVAEAISVIGNAHGTIDALTKAQERIGGVTETVSEIARTSELLALNALVEAAHAGDQGNAFAIVANEMKSLAAQSQQASTTIARDIRVLRTNAAAAIKSLGAISQIVSRLDQSQSSTP